MASAMRWLTGLVVALLVAMVGAAAGVEEDTGRPQAPQALNVSYDRRSLLLDGKRRLLTSGSIHYLRSTPEMWPSLLASAKASGLDAVEVYAFWSAHEPSPGAYTYEGRLDIVRFMRAAQAAGLYVIFRPGAYVCAEFNYGGLPVWLRDVDGMVFRTANKPWMAAMQAWVTAIVRKLQAASLFASQGGPIILTQIENEYGNIESSYPPADAKAYVAWSASMAQALDTGVPWIMCVQPHAPANVISTCNGFYCDDWIKGHWQERPDEPAVWTENWPGWFQHWGEGVPHRPAEDVAFSVARWIAYGGSVVNYYMAHGGTTFGREVGGPMITTSYDYDVVLNEYGQPHEPKYSHLADMHALLHEAEGLLLSMDPPAPQPLCGQGRTLAEPPSYGHANKHAGLNASEPYGPGRTGDCNAEAHVYASSSLTSPSGCFAFLSNFGTVEVTVTFRGASYTLPGWSVSLLPDCRTEAYNTARVTAQTTVYGAAAVGAGADADADADADVLPLRHGAADTDSLRQTAAAAAVAAAAASGLGGEPLDDDYVGTFTGTGFVREPVGVWDTANATGGVLHSAAPLEQIHATGDRTDYLWYTATVASGGVAAAAAAAAGGTATLSVDDPRDVVHVFGPPPASGSQPATLLGTMASMEDKHEVQVPVAAGEPTRLSLLSVSMGLVNFGVHMERAYKGVSGDVMLGAVNASRPAAGWTHQVGLWGEHAQLFGAGGGNATWAADWGGARGQPLVWLRGTFATPPGSHPVVLDLSGMGKGAVWVNGHHLGRYWGASMATTTACDGCDYRGPYTPGNCRTDCGSPSQALYHVPREWMATGGGGGGGGGAGANTVVMFEEVGGSPKTITLRTVRPHVICSQIGEDYPQGGLHVELECMPGQTVASIDFASFGNATGVCGAYGKGACDAANSTAVVSAACLGKRACEVLVADSVFGDPCTKVTKRLTVQATCK